MLSNGVVSPNTKLTVGKTASFRCNAGYTLEGSSILKCLKSGQLDGAIPTCLETVCAVPVAPSNGQVEPSSGTLRIGQQVRFSCREGFEITGSPISYCRSGAIFDSPVPKCMSGI